MANVYEGEYQVVDLSTMNKEEVENMAKQNDENKQDKQDWKEKAEELKSKAKDFSRKHEKKIKTVGGFTLGVLTGGLLG